MVSRVTQIMSDIRHNTPGWSIGSVIAGLGSGLIGWALGDMIGPMLGPYFSGMGAQLISALFVGAAGAMIGGPAIDGFIRKYTGGPPRAAPPFPDTTTPQRGQQQTMHTSAARHSSSPDLAALAGQFQQENASGNLPPSEFNRLPAQPPGGRGPTV